MFLGKRQFWKKNIGDGLLSIFNGLRMHFLLPSPTISFELYD